MGINLKRDALVKWLKDNPSKTERDWLYEERCVNDLQRNDLKRLFTWADKNQINISVCKSIGSFKDYSRSYREVHRTNNPERRALFDRIHKTNERVIHPTIYVETDFQIDRYCYDLDAPDSVFEQSMPDLYLNWKANQMGINPLLVHTDYEVYEVFKPYMGANIPHWSRLIQD